MAAEAIEDLDELVILADLGGIGIVSTLFFELVAGRNREATGTGKHHSFLKFSSTFSDVGIGKRNALSEHASSTPDVRLGSIYALC